MHSVSNNPLATTGCKHRSYARCRLLSVVSSLQYRCLFVPYSMDRPGRTLCARAGSDTAPKAAGAPGPGPEASRRKIFLIPAPASSLSPLPPATGPDSSASPRTAGAAARPSRPELVSRASVPDRLPTHPAHHTACLPARPAPRHAAGSRPGRFPHPSARALTTCASAPPPPPARRAASPSSPRAAARE